MDKTSEEEIEKPVGKFILDNLPEGNRFYTEDGLYIHYTNVCGLLKKYRKQTAIEENNVKGLIEALELAIKRLESTVNLGVLNNNQKEQVNYDLIWIKCRLEKARSTN